MKVLKYILAAFVIVITGGLATAQTKEAKKAAKLAEIRSLVENQNFDFVAQYVTPQGGMRRYLTSSYDMVIKKDSLIAFLPYFGRAYFDVPYNPTDGGIKFTSVNYKYTTTPRKKGGWDIILEPRDVKYYQRINLSVTTDGYAVLNFTPTNRSFISFDGYIQQIETKK